jgi:hypothetical protein
MEYRNNGMLFLKEYSYGMKHSSHVNSKDPGPEGPALVHPRGVM